MQHLSTMLLRPSRNRSNPQELGIRFVESASWNHRTSDACASVRTPECRPRPTLESASTGPTVALYMVLAIVKLMSNGLAHFLVRLASVVWLHAAKCLMRCLLVSWTLGKPTRSSCMTRCLRSDFVKRNIAVNMCHMYFAYGCKH